MEENSLEDNVEKIAFDRALSNGSPIIILDIQLALDPVVLMRGSKSTDILMSRFYLQNVTKQ